MVKVFAVVGVSVLLVVSGGYVYSSGSDNGSNTDMFCHLNKSTSAISKLVSAVTFAQGQDPQQPPQDPPQPQPEQPPQQETDKHCERPNPNGTNPDVGGVDPQKIGCMCARKCDPNSGRPTENYESPETRCKVHCRPNNCECPNPCTKT